MQSQIYSTKKIAELCDVHPNTVRLYEKWGYLSKAERGKNNYRKFTDKHLRQMKLARAALPGPYPIDYIIVHDLVKKYAAGDIMSSMQLAEEYLDKVEAELRKAAQAMEVLDKWVENKPGSKENIVYKTRKKVSAALSLTIDTLRTWERNGLCRFSKDPDGRLQFSEWDMEKLMIICLLRNCGYSIASLLNVFENEENLMLKPSELLVLKDTESGISYFTDRYMEYLEGHIARAKGIICLLSEYNKTEEHVCQEDR